VRGPVTTGTVVAGYRLEALLGEGATGDVYRALDPRGHSVALKVFAPELARDERFRARFVRESEVAARLEHPNIVPTLEAGEENGVLYLAMALVEGSDLRELLRCEGRLDPQRSLALLAQAADALDAAHAAGLVHRDVKPANMLVEPTAEGEHLALCDFGLSRHVSSAASLTGERGFVGTIDYVSPEQIENGSVDRRADVYSLACVLFECLTGRRPFERETELAVVFAHLNEPPPGASELRPELPEAFDEVFRTALAKSPRDRYATCSELVAAARGAMRGEVRHRRTTRRRLAAACALLLAAGAGGVLLGTRHTGHAVRTTAARPVALRPGTLGLIEASTGRVVGHVGLGQTATLDDVDLVVAGRSAWVLLADDDRLLRIDLASRRITASIALPWTPAARIAGGAGLIWVSEDGGPDLLGIDARTAKVARRFAIEGGNGVGVAFGDGSVFLAQGADVARIDPRTGRVLRRIVERPGQVGAVGWLTFADGELWTAQPSDGVIRKIDPVAGTVLATTTLHGWAGDLAVGGGAVWVPISEDGVVYRLSEDDLSVEGTVAAGDDPERISAAGGRIWVANSAAHAISVLSQATGARRRLDMPAEPETVLVRGPLVLATAAPSSPPLPAIQGQQIVISTPRPALHLDPAAPTDVQDAELRNATCANLLAYPDAAGAAGSTLRPEVAAAMPAVSRGGLTYTFRIRPGFRFSPPSNEAVTAATFRHTIERALSPAFKGWADTAVDDIAGEQAFQAGTASHISGVAARGDTLRITLVRPDGSFLTGISMPWFCPVPLALPTGRHPVAGPVPSDGPYYVASSTADRTVLLRNPNYGGTRVRRPARIVFESGTSTPQAVALADRARVDYLPPDFSNTSLLAVAGLLDRRYGPGSAPARAGDQRYLHTPTPGWDGIVFNAARPLFRDVRMRRAVEYALDRRALAAAFNDLPSDQIVPPAVPGFGNAHTYALAPDLATARRLVGGRHPHAVLYLCTNGVFGSPGQERVAALVRSELARIGIVVTITEPSCASNDRYDTHSAHADLILASVFNVELDPEPFVADVLRAGTLGAALGRGLWTEPSFLARVRRAGALRGNQRRAAYLRLERDLLRAAPVAVYGSYYGGDYFSPKVRCRIVPPGVGALDLGALCKTR